MDSNRPVFLMIFPVVLLVCGALLAGYLIDGQGGDHGEWGNKTVSLMYLASILFIWFVFSKIGEKYSRVKLWVLDTVIGSSSMAFFIGFMLVGVVDIYMLLPFPTWLHFSVALALAMLGACLGFYFAATKNS